MHVSPTRGEALATLAANEIRGTAPCASAKELGDNHRREAKPRAIAVLTDGREMAEDLGIEFANINIATISISARRAHVTIDE